MLTPFQTRARLALSESRFFRSLSDECLRWVERTSVRKGEFLFQKHQTADDLYGLVSGQIKLVAAGAGARQISLGLVAPGEFVGEIAISGNAAPRQLGALALANSEVATLRRCDLEPLMERHPDVHVAFLEASAEASADVARRLSQRLEDDAFLSIEARVEKTLADCARRFGERVEQGTRVLLRQQDLADILGLSRESVSKVLTSPAMQRKLELHRGSIVLLGS
jgi:CRP/FNR family cyclic AMP-dependent transcriptional regulator